MKTPASKRTAYIGIIAVTAGALIFFTDGPKWFKASESTIPGVMPACDTPLVKELLSNAVHQSPRGLHSGLRIIALGQVEEYARQTPGPDSNALNDLRFCKAVAFTNAGQGDLHFILKWINAKKDQIWLEITVSTI
jgi:hypothetical protein